MATYTEHIYLKKPAYSDVRDIKDINDNMDLIDETIYGIQNKGQENAGKFMIVGNDGVVAPVTVPFANGGSY